MLLLSQTFQITLFALAQHTRLRKSKKFKTPGPYNLIRLSRRYYSRLKLGTLRQMAFSQSIFSAISLQYVLCYSSITLRTTMLQFSWSRAQRDGRFSMAKSRSSDWRQFA